MERYRVTIRGEGTEIRGYATFAALGALSQMIPGEDPPFIVLASVETDDYDPFKERAEAWQEGYITGSADGESGNHVYSPAPNPYREGGNDE